MGKRGPAPKGEYEGKSRVLSTRIREDTREALVAAAKASGRSISQEIEYRLRRTFTDDKEVRDSFGTRRNRALMKMVAMATQAVYNPKNPDADWLDDPLAFELVVRTIRRVLEAVRPPGNLPELTPFNELRPVEKAAEMWMGVQSADPSLPLNAPPKRALANALKADLGVVADRPVIFWGTADDFRRRADEMEQSERGGKKRRKQQ